MTETAAVGTAETVSVRGSIAATGIVVRDLERSGAFYSKVLGMQELQRIAVPDMHLAEVIMSFPGSRGGALVLRRYTDDVARDYVDIGGKLVLSVDDPAALVEAARSAGAEVIREPAEYPGFGLIGFVADPDGYALELVQAPAVT